jgi:hypothetical protein
MFTIGRGKRLLGVCLGERSLVVSEVAWGGESLPAARTAEFVFPEGLDLNKDKALGYAFGQFLAQKEFAASRVVFGVPARWLVVRNCLVPPADDETAANLLWLDATEHTSRELGEVVYDFAGPTSETDATTVLTLGLQQIWLERLHALAEGAGLKAVAVTSTGVAIGAASARYVENGLVLSIRSDGVELVVREDGYVRSVRHIGPMKPTSALIAQLRRSRASSTGEIGNVAIWDDSGVETELLTVLEGFAGSPVKQATLQWAEIADRKPAAGLQGLASAALTIPFRSDRKPEIDFLHPCLAPPQPANTAGRGKWLLAGIGGVLLAVIIGLADIINLHLQISSADRELQNLQPAMEVARPFVESMQFAESYRTSKPRYLECLKDLTLAITPEEKTYFISFDLGRDMRGSVAGHSDSEQSVLSFLDKLNSGGRFVELHRTLDAHSGRSAGNDVVFSLNFTYQPIP